MLSGGKIRNDQLVRRWAVTIVCVNQDCAEPTCKARSRLDLIVCLFLLLQANAASQRCLLAYLRVSAAAGDLKMQ